MWSTAASAGEAVFFNCKEELLYYGLLNKIQVFKKNPWNESETYTYETNDSF